MVRQRATVLSYTYIAFVVKLNSVSYCTAGLGASCKKMCVRTQKAFHLRKILSNISCPTCFCADSSVGIVRRLTNDDRRPGVRCPAQPDVFFFFNAPRSAVTCSEIPDVLFPKAKNFRVVIVYMQLLKLRVSIA